MFVTVPGVVIEEREQRTGGVRGAQVPSAWYAEIVVGLYDQHVLEAEGASGNAVGYDHHLRIHAHLSPRTRDRRSKPVGSVAHGENDH